MGSNRFQKNIWLTRHAQKRMKQRQVSESMLRDLIETGNLKHKDDLHAWIFKYYPERTDNLEPISKPPQTRINKGGNRGLEIGS